MLFRSQHLDDLWGADGIEGANTALSTHEADPNPHPSLLTETEADGLYVQVDGGNQMTADLDMGDTNKITKLANGTADTDAATLKQVTDGDAAVTSAFEAADTAKVDKAGDTMSGDLAMGGQKITGLANGVAAQDAATVAQLGSVDAPTHDGLADGSPGVGQAWANKHHTRYTDSEAVSAVGPHFSGAHSALSGVGSSDHHSRYTDTEARNTIAAQNIYAPKANPNFTTHIEIGGQKVVDRVGNFGQLWATDTLPVINGDGIDEFYGYGIPYGASQYNLECDEGGGAQRVIRYNAKASTRRMKQDEAPSKLEGGECLGWDITEFRYIKEAELFGDEAKVHNWMIAEDMFDASGEDFIKRDAEGEVVDTHDRAIMADMILTIQALEKRIAELEAR